MNHPQNSRYAVNCPGGHISPVDRRSFMTVGALTAFGGLTLGDMLRHQAHAADEVKKKDPLAGKKKLAVATNVIQIWLPGGCSHMESWDPKPEAPIEYRGPMGIAKTGIPGVAFGESMQKCAEIANKISVVRSVSGKVPDHNLGTYHMLTGYAPSPAIQHPQVGAVVSHELGGMNNLPAWIGVPRASDAVSTGYLSSKYGCFAIGSDPAQKGFQVRDLALPKDMPQTDFQSRQDLRKVIEGHFRKMETNSGALDTMDEFYKQAYSLLSSSQAQQAFKIEDESAEVQQLYGCDRVGGGKQPVGIGQRLMLARRLVEAGARFVTVTYANWDHHQRIKQSFGQHMPHLDHAVAGLIADLEARGLLKTTIVMVMSEFGRTPKINVNAGRDHWARCFSIMVAGGGIAKGCIYGASDATGAEPARDLVTVEDFLCTVYDRLGIDADKRLMAPGDRPIDIIRGGKVIKGLLA